MGGETPMGPGQVPGIDHGGVRSALRHHPSRAQVTQSRAQTLYHALFPLIGASCLKRGGCERQRGIDVIDKVWVL